MVRTLVSIASGGTVRVRRYLCRHSKNFTYMHARVATPSGGAPLRAPLLLRISQRTPHAVGREVRRIHRAAGVLPPRFLQTSGIHCVETQLIHQRNHHLLRVRVIAGDRKRDPAVGSWRHALLRRIQRRRLNWSSFNRLTPKYVPSCRMLRPYPEERFFGSRTLGRSRTRYVAATAETVQYRLRRNRFLACECAARLQASDKVSELEEHNDRRYQAVP